MQINHNMKIMFNKDMIVAKESGSTILLNNQKHVIYILKEFESELIELIEKHQTFGEILRQIENLYVGNNIKEEFCEFIEKLEAIGAILLKS